MVLMSTRTVSIYCNIALELAHVETSEDWHLLQIGYRFIFVQCTHKKKKKCGHAAWKAILLSHSIFFLGGRPILFSLFVFFWEWRKEIEGIQRTFDCFSSPGSNSTSAFQYYYYYTVYAKKLPLRFDSACLSIYGYLYIYLSAEDFLHFVSADAS